MKNLIASVLVVASIVLAYLCYLSIMAPIKFEKERKVRESAVINHLRDIRDSEIQFLTDNKRYCGNLDSLIAYVKTARVTTVIKNGDLTDEQLEKGMTEAEAIKKGIITRDTVYSSFMDTKLKLKYPTDSMAFVPYGNGAKFIVAAAELPTVSNVPLPVFEAKTPFEVYLNGMDEQTITNMKEEALEWDKYPGLQVGSIKISNNNAGNWE